MGRVTVEVRNLSKKFIVRHEARPSLKRFFTRLLRPFPAEELWALQDVSLTLTAGEAVGLIGANGSGKSTLLRVLAGILRPTRGEVRVHGRVGGLFELAAGFHPELSGWDNVRLSGVLMGYSPAAVAQRLDAIVEFSELGPFMDVPVKNYSSGMALRLGFALAVAFQPEIVLVDEVLAVADAHFQRRAYERLAALCAQGSTLILVSHDMAALRQMCGRVVWLDQGRLRADGAPETVIGQYLSRAG